MDSLDYSIPIYSFSRDSTEKSEKLMDVERSGKCSLFTIPFFLLLCSVREYETKDAGIVGFFVNPYQFRFSKKYKQ
jgi:hypothetical protein